VDIDQDGCTNAQELGPDPALGGQRDPLNFWDFFDTPNPGVIPARDRAITISDVLRVLLRFGTTGDAKGDPLSLVPESGYHPAYDRSPPAAGAPVWQAGAADGAITITDVVLIVAQFGHSCAT
jgi:hypothetical protein